MEQFYAGNLKIILNQIEAREAIIDGNETNDYINFRINICTYTSFLY